MTTTFRVNISDLDKNFLDTLKNLFINERELEITIKPSSDFNLNKPETNIEYETRLLNSIKNIESGNNVSFTLEEFENYSNNLMKSNV